MESKDKLDKFLDEHRLLTLDGGMGTLLYREYDVPRDSEVWLLKALTEAEHHDTIVAAHQRYLDAGADILTTFNYTAVPVFVKKVDESLKILPELVATSCKLLRKAIDTYKFTPGKERDILIAGSVPPLFISYQAQTKIDEKVAEEAYQLIIEGLKDHVDFYIAETLSSIEEGLIAARCIQKYDPGKKFFISWSTLQTGKIRSGECIGDAVRRAEADESIAAFGYMINCGAPEKYLELLNEMAAETKKPLGAYANLADQVDGHIQPKPKGYIPPNKDINPEQFEEMHREFAQVEGVRILGGCCRVHPEYIERISKIAASMT